MSNNPFRRSSFKDSGSTCTSRPGPGPEGISAAPLSVNTRVPPSSQKHVEFASPPAIPISPASYPSSPESTRQSPAFRAALPSTPDYSEAIQIDPFREATLADEHDVAIEQAVRNARTNSEITTSKAVQKDAVNDTLSRFANGPQKPIVNPESSSDGDHKTSKPQKQALDVDAFKRLLLTGESTPAPQDGQDTLLAQSTTYAAQLASDSNSSTPSLQRSILESAPQETPRSSIDQETGDGDAPAGPASQAQEARRKPPPPKPRYGKPINESTKDYTHFNAASDAKAVPFVPALHAPPPSAETPDPSVGSSVGFDPSEVKKRPPTPPLTRRKSQKKSAGRPNISRNPSSRNSVESAEEATSPAPIPTPGKMLPPPPPMRRMNSQASRKASTDLPAMEEVEETETGSMDRLPLLSKRISLNPPPPPPPRRARGSSRSSLDGPRPSVAQLGTTSSTRSSGEYRRASNASNASNASMESRKASGPIDILADLAALQREVDAARSQAGR